MAVAYCGQLSPVIQEPLPYWRGSQVSYSHAAQELQVQLLRRLAEIPVLTGVPGGPAHPAQEDLRPSLGGEAASPGGTRYGR